MTHYLLERAHLAENRVQVLEALLERVETSNGKSLPPELREDILAQISPRTPPTAEAQLVRIRRLRDELLESIPSEGALLQFADAVAHVLAAGEVPEVGRDFFKDPIVTQPGEDLVATVEKARSTDQSLKEAVKLLGRWLRISTPPGALIRLDTATFLERQPVLEHEIGELRGCPTCKTDRCRLERALK